MEIKFLAGLMSLGFFILVSILERKPQSLLELIILYTVILILFNKEVKNG